MKSFNVRLWLSIASVVLIAAMYLLPSTRTIALRQSAMLNGDPVNPSTLLDKKYLPSTFANISADQSPFEMGRLMAERADTTKSAVLWGHTVRTLLRPLLERVRFDDAESAASIRNDAHLDLLQYSATKGFELAPENAFFPLALMFAKQSRGDIDGALKWMEEASQCQEYDDYVVELVRNARERSKSYEKFRSLSDDLWLVSHIEFVHLTLFSRSIKQIVRTVNMTDHIRLIRAAIKVGAIVESTGIEVNMSFGNNIVFISVVPDKTDINLEKQRFQHSLKQLALKYPIEYSKLEPDELRVLQDWKPYVWPSTMRNLNLSRTSFESAMYLTILQVLLLGSAILWIGSSGDGDYQAILRYSAALTLLGMAHTVGSNNGTALFAMFLGSILPMAALFIIRLPGKRRIGQVLIVTTAVMWFILATVATKGDNGVVLFQAVGIWAIPFALSFLIRGAVPRFVGILMAGGLIALFLVALTSSRIATENVLEWQLQRYQSLAIVLSFVGPYAISCVSSLTKQNLPDTLKQFTATIPLFAFALSLLFVRGIYIEVEKEARAAEIMTMPEFEGMRKLLQ